MVFRRFKSKNLVLGNGGLTLVEVLISMGLMSIFLVGSMTMVESLNRNTLSQQVSTRRQEIASSIRSVVLTDPTLANSASLTTTLGASGYPPAGNLTSFNLLTRCHPDVNAASGCTRAGFDDPQRGFLFYLATPTSLDPEKALAGENIYYTSTGRRCGQAEAANANACPLFARTWFQPFCVNFAATCNKAVSLAITYSVGVRAGVTKIPSLPPLEGQVNVSLQKGLQISRVYDQNSNAIAANTYGIYSVPKYHGLPGQTVQGLRFETLVSNAQGLSNFKLQARSLTGTAAFNLMDTQVPAALVNQPWVDVAIFGAIPSLPPLQRDQTVVFGTYGGTNLSWDISGKYTWDGTNLVPPAVVSGYYQFRVVASDQQGNLVESNNQATVRIQPVPQVIIKTAVPSSFTRVCGGTSLFTIDYALADDEGLKAATIALTNSNGSVPVTQPILNGNPTTFAGNVSIDLTGIPGNYDLSINVTNPFSTQSSVTSTTIDDVVPSWQIAGSPNSIPLKKTGTLSATYTVGTCCKSLPTSANWNFPAVVNVGGTMQPALTPTAGTSSPITCSVQTQNGIQVNVCQTSVTVSGANETPQSFNTADAVATLSPAPTGGACQLSSNDASKSVSVLGLPTIGFYTSESLWVNAPTNELSATPTVQPFTPTLMIRIAYPPSQPVSVKVTPIANSSPICTVDFAAGTGTTPVDMPCTTTAGLSGQIRIQSQGPGVADAGVTPGPTDVAVIDSTKSTHTTCWADLTTSPILPPVLNITTALPMTGSPYGAEFGDTTVVPVANQMDEGNWNVGNSTKLRCYDGLNLTGFDTGIQNKQENFYSKDRYFETKNRRTGTDFRVEFYNMKFYFPKKADGNYAFGGVQNIPRLLVVARPGTPQWRWGTLGAGQPLSSGYKTGNQSFSDLTPQYCTGGAALTNTKLLVVRPVGFDNADGVLKNNNYGWNGAPFEQADYLMFCSYGHWNPISPSLIPTNLTNF